MNKRRFRACVSVLTLVFGVSALTQETMAQDSRTESKLGETGVAQTSSPEKKISLAEVAPELYYQFRRYPKFYGDPNTRRGGLLERTQLLGSAGGVRDSLADLGFFLDVSVTQYLQGNVSGGTDKDGPRYNGSADYWLTFDSGKAGLWPGGAAFLHAESSWQGGKSVNDDLGSLVPANYDATMPTPGNSKGMALPELYFVQALPANWLAIAGKVDWAGLGDTNVFANSERTQFGYAALVNDPILGAFIPYTSLGFAGVWAPSKEHALAVLGIQSTGNATTSGFDNFNDDYTIGAQYQYSPVLGGNRPGNYRILVGCNTKDVADFAIDPRHLIGEIIGVVPVAEKSSNRSVQLNFDQYLWVKDGGPVAGREGLPPVGIGIFGRAGWAPKDRNVIDQFYSFGIGGFGVLIPGRDHDNWGIGWAGTHISNDLRNDVGLLGIKLSSFEHAGEVFYNFQVTPAIHLTLNAQVINSTAQSVDTAYALGTRLQIDF